MDDLCVRGKKKKSTPWIIQSFWNDGAYNIKPLQKLHSVCGDGPEQVMLAYSRNIDLLSWRGVQEEENKKNKKTIWLPLGTGETAHLSTKDRGGLSCFVWWAEKTRCGLEQRYIPSRINKPPKTHGSTQKRRRWDSETRGKDRQVSGETDVCDRGHSDKLQEKTGWAEASWTEHQICSCWWFALDFMFWADWHLMNNAHTPLELVTIVVSMMLLFCE